MMHIKSKFFMHNIYVHNYVIYIYYVASYMPKNNVGIQLSILFKKLDLAADAALPK